MRRTTMSQTPWLIRAEGPGPERRRAEPTSRASLDLAADFETTGVHLVLHQAVDISFALEAHHLPRGTVDMRSGDPLGAALADPDAVLVSGAGIYIGTPIARDPRWTQLEAAGRSRVLLVTSGLSGEYFGCQLEGSAAARFLDGVREEHVGIAARLTYPDGTVIEVERTTIGDRKSTRMNSSH